jgi:uncharacterized Tic20 family protein
MPVLCRFVTGECETKEWLALTLTWAAIRISSTLWWFALPFYLLLPLLIWKLKRDDRSFHAEQERYEKWNQAHPVASALLGVGAIVSAVWTLVGVVLHFFH